jgi:hypothetical protein
MGMVDITLSKDFREVLVQDFDEDLRHHLIHQRATDSTTKLRYSRAQAQEYRQCLQRRRRVRGLRNGCSNYARIRVDRFERVSVGYDAATRSNTGPGTWQCQHFKSGQVHLIGLNSYIADLGWPRHAANLGPANVAGVAVWRVRATVFGGPTRAGGGEPPRQAEFEIARADDTLLRWSVVTVYGAGPAKTRNDRSWTFSRYGQPVHVKLPIACQTRT